VTTGESPLLYVFAFRRFSGLGVGVGTHMHTLCQCERDVQRSNLLARNRCRRQHSKLQAALYSGEGRGSFLGTWCPPAARRKPGGGGTRSREDPLRNEGRRTLIHVWEVVFPLYPADVTTALSCARQAGHAIFWERQWFAGYMYMYAGTVPLFIIQYLHQPTALNASLGMLESPYALSPSRLSKKGYIHTCLLQPPPSTSTQQQPKDRACS